MTDDSSRLAAVAPVQIGALSGDLRIPLDPMGIVVFAHGSGSSRHSPRNQHVARLLQTGGFATLLMDLLTADEERIDRVTGRLRFDIDLLATRLIGAIDWVTSRPSISALPLGLFGASTGAAAALVAAAVRPHEVAAVVSRGGRPDLAAGSLPHVTAPTLFVVGELDGSVLTANKAAMDMMRGEVSLQIVQRATHLFEEPGALDEVARLAKSWFATHLVAAHSGHLAVQ